MSEILCEWLNGDVKLSRIVVPESLSEEFSTGYLLGELLHKYGLQDDFNQFSQSRVANAKLNNFSRLEPTLQLLGVRFNENVARDIMTGQHGAATELLYELYIALEKKRKAKLTGIALEAMRPAATAKLKSIQSALYQERLKTLLPREADLQLQQISEHFEIKAKAIEKKMARIHIAEQQKIQKLQEEQIAQDVEKHRIGRRRQNEIMAKIQAAVIQVPKAPPNRTVKAIETKAFLKKKKEAEETYKEIKKFEESMSGNAPAVHSKITGSDIQESLQTQKFQAADSETTARTATELLSVYSDDEYIRKIQKRLEEDTFAREQREKRRRKMLMEQLIAHEAQEEAYREEQLIYRLMRQSQQERRIAVQLMHVRHEKDVLRQNRIFREKQYEERRLKDFQEALDREAALAKQEKIDYEEQIIKERECHEKIAVERAQARYKKHYSICREIIDHIIDLSTKVGEYRILTNNKIPLKLMCDWKEFFVNGKPIYEQGSIQPLPNEPSPEQLVELNKISLLDEKDYHEYKSMTGEWCPAEDNIENEPPLNNNILGHVLRRLMDLFYPPKPKPSPPVFPAFRIKGCILGKVFSGKTTCVKFLEKVCSIQVLCVDTLVQEAIQASLKNEMKDEHVIPQKIENYGKQNEVQRNLSESAVEVLQKLQTDVSINGIEGNCPVRKDPSKQEFKSDNSQNGLSKLSVRAQLGAASQKLLKKGKTIPDELLVDILLEAINQTPPEKGWIVDGFPMTINQAKLFEKAYTGIDPEAKDGNSGKLTLVTDPRVPNEPPVNLPAFDVSVLLDVSDTVVLKRLADLKSDKSESHQIQQEGNKQNSDAEITEEEIDLARDQVLPRISSFLETWPKLEKWFSVHQNILVKVNAEAEESLVCEAVKKIIMEEMAKNQDRGSAQEKSPEEKLSPVTSQDLLPPVKSQDLLPQVTSQDLLSPVPVAPPQIKPGSDEWIYVNEPLPKEVAGFLVPYWEMVENTYVNTIKTILRCLRDEQHSVISYLADIRKKFQVYLKCPDLKQEFVSQWQTDFNSIADDLREDEETKEELHQRVTDLRDRLWDICDSKREEAEQERTDIMNDGWLPDCWGIAMNHFFSLMQAEVDRFQDTKRLLHDYYTAMEGKIPTNDSQDFTRIQLLDIIDVEQKEDQNKLRSIPLVSRKLFSPEINITKSKSKGTLQKSSRDENSSEIEVTAFGKGENLITDTWQVAVTAVSDMVTAEIQSREMEEEQQQLGLKGDLKSSRSTSGKAAGRGAKDMKKLSSKSATKKKGPCPTASVAEVPVNPEELKKQELVLKIKQEYFSALKHEEAATKSRLELIKEKALSFVEDLTMKAEETYRDMEKWLGMRFLAEMSSVEKLIEVARHHIESCSKIQYEMTLEETDFFINSDVKVIPDPVPAPQVPHVETSGSGTLTISQLTTFHKQFLQVAPKGHIQKNLFIDIFINFIKLNPGKNCLPDAWMNLMLPDLQNLASVFKVNSEFIDWRRFLLVSAQPWPVPSVTQLLETLHRFKSVDVAGSGFVTQEYYMQVGLWFSGNENLSITKSCTEPLPLDRLGHLIKFFFSLFADTSKDPALLNYTEMLLYFASHSDPVEGVYRALSVATGTYIHRKTEASLPAATFLYTNIMPNEKTLIEDEKEVLKNTSEGIISVATLLKVFRTRGSKEEDSNRFSTLGKEGSYDKHFMKICKDLGTEDLKAVPVALLLKHPFIQDLINSCQEYKLPILTSLLRQS
ncbi:sperm flagellar protein 2 isoform X2 [Cuculus canorus]|uniref:sperm flagellar protein 2 isoform X2 n=1 Tax=Cuculus canorus TaxID=55661 RepID=UPI0023AAF155|nr:sperm flagellar protein 2 isoform X2 [Cuculus canorus]